VPLRRRIFQRYVIVQSFSQKGVPLRHDGIRPGAGDWFVTLEEN
jgi:hypothetical protein